MMACGTEAPLSVLEPCVVLANEPVARDLWHVVLEAPVVAARLEAGQFVHLRLPAFEAHILRRPFSVFELDAERGTLGIAYQVVGEGTRYLAGLESGAALDLIGPLGRGWRVPETARRVLLVAGGVGLAPLNMLLAPLAKRCQVHLIAGAQSAERLMPLEGLDGRIELTVTTDDGTAGHKGFTTDVARELLAQRDFDYIATCGPEPMQRTVAALAREAGVACEVSLERRMACGVGACLSCVVATTAGNKRVCVDGPVFDSQEVIW
jgi:dihydroorotate dehydrogenase electron transfer subunit